jgi:hypothetical protein
MWTFLIILFAVSAITTLFLGMVVNEESKPSKGLVSALIVSASVFFLTLIAGNFLHKDKPEPDVVARRVQYDREGRKMWAHIDSTNKVTYKYEQ